jgi:hypothetical protein
VYSWVRPLECTFKPIQSGYIGDFDGGQFLAEPRVLNQMRELELRGDGTRNAPFAANFFIATEKVACGTNDTRINDLVS